MDYEKISRALEQTAATVEDVNAFSYVPDSLPNIGFYVGEIDVELNVTMRGKRTPGGPRRGTDQANITCRILVARYDDEQGVQKLRQFMSGTGMYSIVDAIEQNRQLELDGEPTVDDSRVTTLRGNRMFDVGGHKYYGVEINLFVIGDA